MASAPHVPVSNGPAEVVIEVLDDGPGASGLAGPDLNDSGAIEVARRHRPDVVLMDIRMRDMDGLEATSRILAEADWDVRC